MFTDRLEAGERLARALDKYRGGRALVLAIPRGAAVAGRVVADALDGDLDLVFVRKLRAPNSDEVAVGAVDERGQVHVTENARAEGADDAYIEREATTQIATIRAQRVAYTPGRTALDPRDRLVVVVDDGIASGAAMSAALRAVRARGVAWLVCAVPVASRHGLAHVRPLADEIVCLAAPADFSGVSVWYDDFRPVGDKEVARLLASR